MEILRIHNVGIAVRNVRNMGAFFIEKLNLKVDFKLDIDPVFARVYIGSNYLYLFETRSQDIVPRRKVIASYNRLGFDHITIECEDIDKSYTSMHSKGVEFDDVPYTYPDWGVRLVAFKDPEENWYYLFQRVLVEGGKMMM